MDERVNKLCDFGYVGNTAMKQTILSRSGSGSSESSCEALPPFMDLTGGLLA